MNEATPPGAAVAPAGQRTPFGRPEERSFVGFVRGLYGFDGVAAATPRRAVDLATGLEVRDGVRPLLAAVAPVLVHGTWRYLATIGGYRHARVVVGGRERVGRIWDEAMWGREPLRITGRSVLWLAAAHDALAGDDEAAARALDLAVGPPIEAGDRLALSAAVPALRARWDSRLPEPVRSLAARLPLPALLDPMANGDEPIDLPAHEDAESLALQYAADSIANAWAEALAVKLRLGADRSLHRLHGRLAELFDALFRTAIDGTFDHRLVPVARVLSQLWRRLGGAEQVEAFVTRASAKLPTHLEREAFERGVGAVLQAGERLDDRVRAILSIPWPDRTDAQKRLAAEHETRYRPIHASVRILSRRLRREIG